MTPELIEKFSKLSEEQQNEVVRLIEQLYSKHEHDRLMALAEKIIEENTDVFKALANS